MRGAYARVYVRVAECAPAVMYLDLANEEWEAAEITRKGWRTVKNPPVRLRRARGMRPLPRPVAGGGLDELDGFLNPQGRPVNRCKGE